MVCNYEICYTCDSVTLLIDSNVVSHNLEVQKMFQFDLILNGKVRLYT